MTLALLLKFLSILTIFEGLANDKYCSADKLKNFVPLDQVYLLVLQFDLFVEHQGPYEADGIIVFHEDKFSSNSPSLGGFLTVRNSLSKKR